MKKAKIIKVWPAAHTEIRLHISKEMLEDCEKCYLSGGEERCKECSWDKTRLEAGKGCSFECFEADIRRQLGLENKKNDFMEYRMECVKKLLGEDELLLQIAEECNELGQVALKLRRAKNGLTPVSVEEAHKKLLEEVADVVLCLDVLGFGEDLITILNIMDYKLTRWKARLEHQQA